MVPLQTSALGFSPKEDTTNTTRYAGIYNKDTKKFKGHKIRRPNGRSAVQKNLVLDLSKEIVKEQTDNLLKNK